MYRCLAEVHGVSARRKRKHENMFLRCFLRWNTPSSTEPLQSSTLIDGYAKKESGRAGFFCYLLFPIVCFLYTLLPSPRDTLELLRQTLIQRNIRYWLNTSLFNFETHKRLTVNGVCTAAMGFTSDACWFLLIKTLLIKNNKKREAALKNEAGGDEKRFFLLGLIDLLWENLSRNGCMSQWHFKKMFLNKHP